MNKFTPSSDYHLLLRQAQALHSLCSSYEKQVIHWKSVVDKLTRDIALNNSVAMEQERATNEVLTQYVEELENKIEELKRGKKEA